MRALSRRAAGARGGARSSLCPTDCRTAIAPACGTLIYDATRNVVAVDVGSVNQQRIVHDDVTWFGGHVLHLAAASLHHFCNLGRRERTQSLRPRKKANGRGVRSIEINAEPVDGRAAGLVQAVLVMVDEKTDTRRFDQQIFPGDCELRSVKALDRIEQSGMCGEREERCVFLEQVLDTPKWITRRRALEILRESAQLRRGFIEQALAGFAQSSEFLRRDDRALAHVTEITQCPHIVVVQHAPNPVRKKGRRQ